MSSEFVPVGPDLARQWLELTPSHQRRMSAQIVNKYAAEMRAGRWRQTGEPITFDTNGHLIQGRHRLSAVVQSGVTLLFLVVRGAPVDSFAVIDIQRTRTAAQFMPGSYQHTVVSAARILWAVDKGITVPTQYAEWKGWAIDRQIEYIEQWPELQTWVSMCDGAGRKSKIGTKFLLAVAAQAARTDYRDGVEPFLIGVREGEADDWLSMHDPRHAVREKFLRASAWYNSVTSAQDAGYSLVVKAWNAYAMGQPMTKGSLSVKTGREARTVVVGSPVNFKTSPIIPLDRSRSVSKVMDVPASEAG